ncbi:MAG TPA: hypothetical protein VM093_00125 [Aeromicrobium sp.]|nr:hypothetical protein [Aeromicrobium sp.]
MAFTSSQAAVPSRLRGERPVRVVDDDVAAGRVHPKVAGGLAVSRVFAGVRDDPGGADRADADLVAAGVDVDRAALMGG